MRPLSRKSRAVSMASSIEPEAASRRAGGGGGGGGRELAAAARVQLPQGGARLARRPRAEGGDLQVADPALQPLAQDARRRQARPHQLQRFRLGAPPAPPRPPPP